MEGNGLESVASMLLQSTRENAIKMIGNCEKVAHFALGLIVLGIGVAALLGVADVMRTSNLSDAIPLDLSQVTYGMIGVGIVTTFAAGLMVGMAVTRKIYSDKMQLELGGTVTMGSIQEGGFTGDGEQVGDL